MISFNQHVLVRGRRRRGHLAQRGALPLRRGARRARLVPDSCCAGVQQLRDPVLLGDISNAYGYLERSGGELPDRRRPARGGTLTERGAALAVRALAGRSLRRPPSRLATELTRELVQTNRTGAANVEAVDRRADFPTLVAAVAAGQLPRRPSGLHPARATGCSYTSSIFRQLYRANFHRTPVFRKPYPLDARRHHGRHLRPDRRAARGLGPARADHPAAGSAERRASCSPTATASDRRSASAACAPRIALVRIR